MGKHAAVPFARKSLCPLSHSTTAIYCMCKEPPRLIRRLEGIGLLCNGESESDYCDAAVVAPGVVPCRALDIEKNRRAVGRDRLCGGESEYGAFTVQSLAGSRQMQQHEFDCNTHATPKKDESQASSECFKYSVSSTVLHDGCGGCLAPSDPGPKAGSRLKRRTDDLFASGELSIRGRGTDASLLSLLVLRELHATWTPCLYPVGPAFIYIAGSDAVAAGTESDRVAGVSRQVLLLHVSCYDPDTKAVASEQYFLIPTAGIHFLWKLNDRLAKVNVPPQFESSSPNVSTIPHFPADIVCKKLVAKFTEAGTGMSPRRKAELKRSGLYIRHRDAEQSPAPTLRV
ncbi:unnamed protein product [Diplocarpon coronariae]|nr:hypothetical protein JHW43_004083 [Diplocarpon mali]